MTRWFNVKLIKKKEEKNRFFMVEIIWSNIWSILIKFVRKEKKIIGLLVILKRIESFCKRQIS